jgi:hypothetical protein
MPKINIAIYCFIFPFSCYSRAQTENKIISTKHVPQIRNPFYSIPANGLYQFLFGYSDLSKQRATADAVLPVIQDENKLKEINALQFEKSIQKIGYHFLKNTMSFCLSIKISTKSTTLSKIATKFLCDGKYSLYFMAVYNTVRYADPFIEKIYLISTKDNKPVDMKRIYLHHEGEMGWANYTLFNIDKNYIISLQDYEFSESPFTLKPCKNISSFLPENLPDTLTKKVYIKAMKNRVW